MKNLLVATDSKLRLVHRIRLLLFSLGCLLAAATYADPLDIVSTSLTGNHGDHRIRPNECNNFNITIANNTGTPMTGVSAILSFFSVFSIEITQPYSAYPDVPANGQSTNTTPFQISSLPGFFCNDAINLMLSVSTTSHGSFAIPFTLDAVGTSDRFRFDVSVPTNIPGAQLLESTNVVTGVVAAPTNITVSVWLKSPADSNMSISLIAPNGAVTLLSSGNGGASSDFGVACSPDTNRTSFDDSASTSITTATAPFVGSFRPQIALSNLLASPADGNWRLRITDNGDSANSDILQCWSLFLYTAPCNPGSGACGRCLPPINGSISTNDPVEINRVSRNLVDARCAASKAFPGTVAGSFHYDAYTFANTSPFGACVAIDLRADGCDLQAIPYLGSFDPENIASNYLGDAGFSTAELGGVYYPFACSVPAGATFVVVVNEIDPNIGCTHYTLSLSGLPCPQPTLNVQALPNSSARLSWANSAGGYILESSPSANPATWTTVTNEPLVNSGNYNVTNDTAAPNKLYRLHKP